MHWVYLAAALQSARCTFIESAFWCFHHGCIVLAGKCCVGHFQWRSAALNRSSGLKLYEAEGFLCRSAESFAHFTAACHRCLFFNFFFLSSRLLTTHSLLNLSDKSINPWKGWSNWYRRNNRSLRCLNRRNRCPRCPQNTSSCLSHICEEHREERWSLNSAASLSIVL